eukprot:scaffold55094_cov57-Phaeocystis_antarctica.AAC.5
MPPSISSRGRSAVTVGTWPASTLCNSSSARCAAASPARRHTPHATEGAQSNPLSAVATAL